MQICVCIFFFFFFNDTATTEIYTLSLHDALPNCTGTCSATARRHSESSTVPRVAGNSSHRSEEHTSELQSRRDLVCRLLLEKKKKKIKRNQKPKKKQKKPIQHQ